MWGDKRYHTLNYELRKEFGKKIMKLSLDGGFTCPNRDGTIGYRGCIFLWRGRFWRICRFKNLSIKEQIKTTERIFIKQMEYR